MLLEKQMISKIMNLFHPASTSNYSFAFNLLGILKAAASHLLKLYLIDETKELFEVNLSKSLIGLFTLRKDTC